jgi:hypothetical protein
VGGKEEGEPEERQGGKVDNGTAYTHSVFNWIAGKYGKLREKKFKRKKKNLLQLLVYRVVTYKRSRHFPIGSGRSGPQLLLQIMTRKYSKKFPSLFPFSFTV